MTRRVDGMLGLCARAGKLVSGAQAVEAAIKNRSARLVLIDAGMSAGSRKAITDACAYRAVPWIEWNEQSLGHAIGKPGRMAVAVTDAQFAARIHELSGADM